MKRLTFVLSLCLALSLVTTSAEQRFGGDQTKTTLMKGKVFRSDTKPGHKPGFPLWRFGTLPHSKTLGRFGACSTPEPAKHPIFNAAISAPLLHSWLAQPCRQQAEWRG